MAKRKTFHNPDEQAAYEAEQRALKRLIKAGGRLATSADIQRAKARWRVLEAQEDLG